MRWLLVLALISACGGAARPAPAAAPIPPASRPTPEENAPLRLGMVLLAKPVLPTPDAIAAAYAEIAPGGPALVLDDDEPSEQALVFLIDGQRVVAGLIPTPIPGGEADAHAQFSVYTLVNGWRPEAHVAHLLVMLQPDDRKPVDAMRDFTRALAAVTSPSDAVGVYIGDAGATHEPAFFVDAVRKAEHPMIVWTGVSMATDGPDRASLLSHGMDQFGLPEILIGTSKPGWPDALAYLFDLSLYIAQRGEAIPDGDTVGRSADEKLPVRYVPSPVDASTQVLRVDMP